MFKNEDLPVIALHVLALETTLERVRVESARRGRPVPAAVQQVLVQAWSLGRELELDLQTELTGQRVEARRRAERGPLALIHALST